VNYGYSYTADNNDSGTGVDFVMAVCFNGDGSLVDTDRIDGLLGAAGGTNSCHSIYLTISPENDPGTLSTVLASPLIAKSCFAGEGFAGPAVPEGWVLRYMTCSTAVYDMPGGQPVGNDAVWAGQSFYVNPDTKKDASGKSWSQVFVSSWISPWIPTSCVSK
jgi:hypothetical protein